MEQTQTEPGTKKNKREKKKTLAQIEQGTRKSKGGGGTSEKTYKINAAVVSRDTSCLLLDYQD